MHRIRHFLFSTVFTKSPDFTLCNDRRLNPVLRLKLVKHRYFLVIPSDTILCSTCRFFADCNFLVAFSCDSSELDNKGFFLTNFFYLVSNLVVQFLCPFVSSVSIRMVRLFWYVRSFVSIVIFSYLLSCVFFSRFLSHLSNFQCFYGREIMLSF